jgi:HK97 gp10 family phage protein
MATMVAGWEQALLGQPGVRRYLEGLAADAEDDAVRLAPVLSGRLRDSISSGVSVDAQGPFGWVDVGVDYWMFPEFGTEDTPAEPYIRPAVYRRRG